MIGRAFEDLRLSGSLPTPAGVGMRILELTRTEDYSAEEMAEVLRSDPSLTSRILKLANSADRGGVEPCTSVQDALMRLGGRTVRDLALAFSLVSARRGDTCPGFDYEQYWGRSLARAVAAQALAARMGHSRPQEAYVCGLLAEIGALALASVHPRTYGSLLMEHRGVDRAKLRAAEQQAFDIDHVQAAACLFSDWGLPEHLGLALLDAFGGSETQDAAATTLARVLKAADCLAEGMSAPRSREPREWQATLAALGELAATLGLDEAAFAVLFDGSSRAWVGWGRLLGIPTADPRGLEQLRRWSQRVTPRREAAAGGPHSRRAAATQDEPSEGAQETGRAPIQEVSERFRILVVDDDPVSLRLASHLLSADGYEVLEARGGQEGLRMALEHAPDIVLSDLAMPEMDGFELCRALRQTELGSRMFIVLVTAHEEDETIVRAFDAEADDFIVKPYLPRVLCARVRGGIRATRLQRKVALDRQKLEAQKAELGRLNRKLQIASLTDPLTGLPNRRHAMNRLQQCWAASPEQPQALSLAMLDVDHFKRVNDEHGHDVGDLVLVEVARMLAAQQQGRGEVCRLGGEEFVVVLPGITEARAAELAEEWCRAIEASVARAAGLPRPLTVSIGIASRRVDTLDSDQLLKAADQALYAAKAGGRNRVVVDGWDVLRRSA
ncbi:MAG: HDOD domain-containing protein [Planctomycetota bacterium]|nr:HDOD domain-containing protein [Planctomycetota bacterium]